MVKLDYPDILDTISDYKISGRSESAAFLCWYLAKYYRLDDIDAIDSICDEKGDKGVDGIYVNETDNSIDIFQAKISQKSNTSIGDTVLKEFVGTLTQFKDREAVANLKATSGDTQLVKLIERLDIVDKTGNYEVRGRFLSNVDIDANGQAFLASTPGLKVIGKKELIDEYVVDSRATLVKDKAEFDLFGVDTAEYKVDEKTKCILGPVKATELVKMQGISDQSVFDANIRGHLGNTKVNKDIVSSIKDKELHRLFPLFHNGITVTCEDLQYDDKTGRIVIKNYGVVNGCQSLRSLHGNSDHITDDLRVMTRFIQVDPSSDLLNRITNYSNNQNGIKARDFKSNNQIQVRLQTDFNKYYREDFFFEVKRGEKANDKPVLTNEHAGQLLIAFDLKEPWTAHKKYQIFDERYAAIFGRPEVTADRIVMLHVFSEVITKSINKFENQLVGRYSLTKYLILYMLRLIFETDIEGKRLISNPATFVRRSKAREKLALCAEALIEDMIVDINGELKNVERDFDYKSKL